MHPVFIFLTYPSVLFYKEYKLLDGRLTEWFVREDAAVMTFVGATWPENNISLFP